MSPFPLLNQGEIVFGIAEGLGKGKRVSPHPLKFLNLFLYLLELGFRLPNQSLSSGFPPFRDTRIALIMALNTVRFDGVQGFLNSLRDVAMTIQTFNHIGLDAWDVHDANARFPVEKPFHAQMAIPTLDVSRALPVMATRTIGQKRLSVFFSRRMTIKAFQVHSHMTIVGEQDLVEGNGTLLQAHVAEARTGKVRLMLDGEIPFFEQSHGLLRIVPGKIE